VREVYGFVQYLKPFIVVFETCLNCLTLADHRAQIVKPAIHCVFYVAEDQRLAGRPVGSASQSLVVCRAISAYEKAVDKSL